jgi:hypothetical protein
MRTRFNCRKELAMSRFNQSPLSTAIAAPAEPAVATPADRALDVRLKGTA